MAKRSMVVDLNKLARKYPSEVRALLGAMDLDKTVAKVRRMVSAENGNLDARGHIKRPTFDGVPGLPAWKVARRLGWKTCMVRMYSHLYGLRSLPYFDGTTYFDPVDVERVAKMEEQKARDKEGAKTPVALSLLDAAKATKQSVSALKAHIRERRVLAYLRGKEVRVPMSEVEMMLGAEAAA